MHPECCHVENGCSCGRPAAFTVVPPGDGPWYGRYTLCCATHVWDDLYDDCQVYEGVDL